jgi:regulator of sirC expression with transglutaminase-like and TPR domain
VHLRRAEWRAALSDFDRSIKLRPDGAWSLYGRGLVHAHQGNAYAARADIAAARRLEPKIDANVEHDGVAGDLKAP